MNWADVIVMDFPMITKPLLLQYGPDVPSDNARFRALGDPSASTCAMA